MLFLVPLLLATGFSIPPTLETTLEKGSFVGTPGGFHIIALSHLADGCAAHRNDDAVKARHCVEQAFAQAMKTRPQGTAMGTGANGLWLTHLALILGDGDRTGPCLDEALHQKVVTGLAKRSLADPTGHVPSYANKRERWPADQAATLAALYRYDVSHTQTLLPAVLAKYRETMIKAVDGVTSLPWSEVHGTGTGKMPRGCALSWSVRYLSEVDRDHAKEMWTAYRKHYFVDAGYLVGFREWPPGVDRKGDVDSGPIVQGVGAAATAFGIAAARAMDDDTLAFRLEGTAAIVGAATRLNKKLKGASSTTLAEAIRFQASAQRSVFETP